MDDNECVELKDEKGNPILKFGDLTHHKKGTGANCLLYVNTFQLEKDEKFEYDFEGNIISKEAPTHFLFNKTKGVVWEDAIIKRVEEVEKILLAYNEIMLKKDPKKVINKVDCFIVTKEVIPPKKVTKYSTHECIIDHIHFLVD
jgi:hypothetical protein